MKLLSLTRLALLWFLIPLIACDCLAAKPVPISEGDFDKFLAAARSSPPSRLTLEIYSVEKRIKKNDDDVEASVRKMIDQLEKDGATPPGVDKEALIQMNVKARLKLQSEPHVTRELFRTDNTAVRRDWVDSHDLVEVTAKTSFHHTYITPGDPKAGDGRFYIYAHNLKSATRNKYNPTRQVPLSWKRVFGYWEDLQKIVLMSVVEVPKPDPSKPRPKMRLVDAPLSAEKIRAIVDGVGELRLTVDDLGEVDGVPRKQINIDLAQLDKRIVTLVVDANDFSRAYEQTIFTPEGKAMIQVVSDGFNDDGVPREVKWIRQRPGGEESMELLVLDASLGPIDSSLYEFSPPNGFAVVEIGPDGRGAVDGDATRVESSPGSGVFGRIAIWNFLVIVGLLVVWGINKRRTRKKIE